MYITQRLACVLHHLCTALAKVLHCGVHTTGKLETEQCVRYKEVDLRLVQHLQKTCTGKLETEQCLHYKEVDLRLVQHLQKTCTDMSVSCLLSEKVRVMVLILRATGNSYIKNMIIAGQSESCGSYVRVVGGR